MNGSPNSEISKVNNISSAPFGENNGGRETSASSHQAMIDKIPVRR